MTHRSTYHIYNCNSYITYFFTKFKLIAAMRHFRTILHLLLINLLMVSSETVTVQPASRNKFPSSVWLSWPRSTNKAALTIQCSSYDLKVTFLSSDGFAIGAIEIKSPQKELWIYCNEGGTKDWYGGNLLTFPTDNWGICSSGTTETLIIERTSKRLNIMRDDDVVVFSRNWAATDGKCLLKAGFWRLQNYGTTVVSAKSILGIEFFNRTLTLFRSSVYPTAMWLQFNRPTTGTEGSCKVVKPRWLR